MKVEYFPTKNWYSSKRNRSYLRTVSCHGIEKLLSVKCLDGFVLCIQGWQQGFYSREYLNPGVAWCKCPQKNLSFAHDTYPPKLL